jgi:glycosyltransferase involved in cell wall biosynthesis
MTAVAGHTSTISKPTVSIITAAYNRSGVLRYTIESVLRQTFESWELIVVGDRCTDDTQAVVESFDDDRITFVNLARRTGEQSGPHNLGAALSRGDYIAYLNHDDLWLPDHLRLCWEAMATEPADVVFGTCACIGRRAPLPLRFDDLDIALVGLFATRAYSPVAGIRAVASASSLFMRREALDRLGGWRHSRDIHVEPSQDLVFRAWRHGLRVHALNLVTVVILSAGHRPGSYLSGRSDHAAWLFENVVVPNRGTELAALALETNDAFVARQPRPSWFVNRMLHVVAALGVNPRAVEFRFAQRLRRGEYLDRLRALRGVPLVGSHEAPGPQLRREMVDRDCRLDVGTTVHFAAGQPGTRLLATGWSRPDSAGVWNDGDAAELLLDVGDERTDGLELSLVLRPFHVGTDVDAERRADIFVADELIESVSLDARFRPELRVPLPAHAFRGSRVCLRFLFSDSVSPQSLGQSPDPRRLSLGLVTATLARCTSPSGARS